MGERSGGPFDSRRRKSCHSDQVRGSTFQCFLLLFCIKTGLETTSKLCESREQRVWEKGLTATSPFVASRHFPHIVGESSVDLSIAAGSRSRLPPRSVLLCFAQRCPPDTRTLSLGPVRNRINTMFVRFSFFSQCQDSAFF